MKAGVKRTGLKVEDPGEDVDTGDEGANNALRMVRDLSERSGYKLGSNKMTPGKDGKVHIQCSTFVAQALKQPLMDTDSLWNDARRGHKHYQEVPHGQQRAGDVLVYPDYKGDDGKVHQGHMAVVINPDPQHMTIADSGESDDGVHHRLLHPAFATQEKTIFARPIKRQFEHNEQQAAQAAFVPSRVSVQKGGAWARAEALVETVAGDTDGFTPA